MTTFLDYALPGIPYGCDFALLAIGLVLTFQATGVLNLAFGAQAFTAAFVFDLLVRDAGLPVWAAFLVSVLVLSPALGLALDRFLYRHIPASSTTAAVVTTVGLLIALPQTLSVVFGNKPRPNPPSLWLSPTHIYLHVAHTPVNGTELSTTVITVGLGVLLAVGLRRTGLGLRMRAVVESRRLAQLDGVDSAAVAAWAWALSSVLAGLAGVLLLSLSAELLPSNPLQYTSLLVAGLTAAALAGLRSVPVALGGGVALGVLQNLLAGYLPSGSILATNVQPALPFVVLVAVLLLHPGLRRIEHDTDPLAVCDPPPPPPAVTVRDRRLDRPTTWGFRALVVAFLVSSLTWVPGFWVTSLAEGLALSIVFLSITLITGMSGQLSLCQATFAGLGAFTAGQLAAHTGLPVLLGAVAGALVAAAAGLVLALVAIRLSGLLLALATLAFALFSDTVLFQYSWVGGGLTGVTVPRPRLGGIDFGNDRYFLVLTFVVLVAVAGVVLLVQRGTVGRYLAAMRGSPVATASLGISLTRLKVTVFALSAAIAAVGGTFYGSLYGNVSSTSFVYEYSLIYVVAVVTTGARTVEGAIQAGMAFAIFQTVLTYLPQRVGGVEPILFALGALTFAAHPEGIVEYQKTKWLRRVNRLLQSWDDRHRPAAPLAVATVPPTGPGEG